MAEKDLTFVYPRDCIAGFCQRWKIREVAVFGSAARGDFGPQSDIDLLVTFADDADWGMLDHASMQNELQSTLRRRVDLVSKRAVEKSTNWLRRREILTDARLIYPFREAGYAAG